MANATTNLLVAGLLVVLPVSAGNPGRGQGAQDTVPDVIVYVEGELVAPSVLLRAEAMATRMFAGVGVRVQWTSRRPGRRAEAASDACAPKRPEQIVVRMASGRAGFAKSDAFAYALPYASDGVRVTVFYGELRKAFFDRPRLEPVMLAHVLVHEITHVLQGVAQHSSTGVMQARWNPTEYSGMENKPLEFAGYDAELIQRGLRRTRSPACVGTASALSVEE
jgi:hypothetical protein